MKYLRTYNNFIVESLNKIQETNNSEFLKYWNKLPADIREKCENIDHNNPHHQEGSILNHIALVFDCVMIHYKNDIDLEYLKIAAILHDLGKTVEEIKIEKEGKTTFNKHELKSMEMIDDLLKLYDIEDKEKVKFIVANHMLVHNMDKLGLKIVRELMSNKDYFNALIKFGKCDEGGRYTKPNGREKQEDIDKEIDQNVQIAIKNAELEEQRKIKREEEQEKARIKNQQIRDFIEKNPNITILELQEIFDDVHPKAVEGIYKNFKNI